MVKSPSKASWILVSSCFHVYTWPSPLGAFVNDNFCCLSSTCFGMLSGFNLHPLKCLFIEVVPFRFGSTASKCKQYLHSAHFLSVPSSSFIHSISNYFQTGAVQLSLPSPRLVGLIRSLNSFWVFFLFLGFGFVGYFSCVRFCGGGGFFVCVGFFGCLCFCVVANFRFFEGCCSCGSSSWFDSSLGITFHAGVSSI